MPTSIVSLSFLSSYVRFKPAQCCGVGWQFGWQSNHVSGHRAGVAGIHNRATYAKEMREALERWGNHVETLVK
jgi:hypothetical protein